MEIDIGDSFYLRTTRSKEKETVTVVYSVYTDCKRRRQ